MSGVFNIGGYSLPISPTGNVSLDSFENFPGDFKNAYDAVANRLGTSDDKRVDAERRRRKWNSYREEFRRARGNHQGI